MREKLKVYGFFGFISLVCNKIKTWLFFSKSRLIRYPIIIRGKRNIDFGNNLTTGVGCRIEAFSNNKNNVIIFGDNIQINDYVHITAMNKVVIGSNVLMASKIYISDCSHGFYDGGDQDSSPYEKPIDRKYKLSEVIIEDNVWLGEFVSVLPGVMIGKGSIIGANSVVTNNIPPNCIAVGTPARVIKEYDFEDQKWKKVKKEQS